MNTQFKTLMLIIMSCFAQNLLQAQDRVLEDILLPDSLFFCKAQTFTVKVVVRSTINDTFRISYQLGNQPRVEEIVDRPASFNNDSIHYTFRVLATVPTNLNDTLRVKILTPDLSVANNERFIVIRNAPTYTLPLVQDFEERRFPPIDWSRSSPGYYDATWAIQTLGRDGRMTRAALFNEGYDGRFGTVPPEKTIGYLMLPALDFKGKKNPFLVFDLALIYEPFLTFGIEVSTDCGASFKNLYTKEGRNGNVFGGPYFNNDWVRDSINLLQYADSTVLIRFYAKHFNREGLIAGPYLDNILVYDAPILAKDAAITQIISPVLREFCPSKIQIPVEIEIKNTGTTAIDTFVVSYKMDGTPSVSETIVRSLAYNQTFRHKFSRASEIPQDGNINLTVSVKVSGDEDIRNDTRTLLDMTYPRYNLTYFEDFEAPYLPPQNFPQGATSYQWLQSNRIVVGRDGNPTKAPSSVSGNSQRISMVLPFLDLRDNNKPFLTFDVAYPKLDTNFSATAYRRQDSLRVQVSTDCGRSYKTIYEKRGDTLTTSTQTPFQYQMEWNPNSANDWRRDTASLAQFKDSVVLIRFVSLMGGYGSTYLDNLKVEPGFDYDMGIVERLQPSSTLICANDRKALPVRFTIRNNAFLAADSVQLSYQLDTEGVVSVKLVRRINPRDTVQYQFHQLMNVAATGKHDLMLVVKYLNDENTKNDTLKTTFTVGKEYIPNLLEDFEASAFPPLDWQIRSAKAKVWDRALVFGSISNQYTNAVTSGNGYSYTDLGAVSSLISNPVNLSNTEKPVLIFDRFAPYFNPSSEKDSLVIEVSKDCGVTYQSIGYVRTGDSLSTINDRRFTPSSSTDWKIDTVDLSAFKGNTIQVRFNRIYQGGPVIYFDNVRFVNIIPKNLSLVSLINPVDTTPLCPDNPFVLAFNIRNDGTRTVDTFNIKYQIDNQNEITERIVLSIQPNGLKTYKLPFLLNGLTAGQHKLRVILNLTGDADNVLDTLFQNITVQKSLKSPIFEDFDNLSSFPPTGWIIQKSNINSWQKASVISKYGTTTQAAYFGNINNKGLKDALIVAPIDLKGISKPRLLFDIANARFSNNSNDTLQIDISTDCGINYKKIYLKSGTALATASNWSSSAQWSPTAFLWRTDSVDLTAFTDSLVLLRFVNIGSNGHQLYLDDIRVADSAAIVKTKDIALEYRSKVFPNPTSDNLIIEIDKPDTQPIKLELINTQGKTVKSDIKSSWDTPQYQWSIQDLPAGIYMLNIYSHQRVEQHKVILIK